MNTEQFSHQLSYRSENRHTLQQVHSIKSRKKDGECGSNNIVAKMHKSRDLGVTFIFHSCMEIVYVWVCTCSKLVRKNKTNSLSIVFGRLALALHDVRTYAGREAHIRMILLFNNMRWIISLSRRRWWWVEKECKISIFHAWRVKNIFTLILFYDVHEWEFN